ncbi:MAG: chemotaxis protein CheW [Rhodospirillaceae bacterium]
MSRALVFTLGPYRLLAGVERVREVREQGATGRVRGGGHLSWRNRLVPEIGLRALLGLGSAGGDGRVDIIYGDFGGYGDGGDEVGDEALVTFEVDRVLGLRNLEDGRLHLLPALAPDLSRLFDVIFLDPADGRGILCLDARPEVLLGLWRAHCETDTGSSGSRRLSS